MRSLLMLTILACGCASWSARRAAFRSQQELLDAMRARDTGRLRALVAPDFRWNDDLGKERGRDEWLAHLAERPGTIQSVTLLRGRPENYDDRVTVCGKQRVVFVVDGEERIDDRDFCADWKERDGRWLLYWLGQPVTAL